MNSVGYSSAGVTAVGSTGRLVPYPGDSHGDTTADKLQLATGLQCVSLLVVL